MKSLDRIAKEFVVFHAEHPEVYETFRETAFELIKEGKPYGLFEVSELSRKVKGASFRNEFRTFYGALLVKNEEAIRKTMLAPKRRKLKYEGPTHIEIETGKPVRLIGHARAYMTVVPMTIFQDLNKQRFVTPSDRFVKHFKPYTETDLFSEVYFLGAEL